jgi:septal ring factor EnvC (AmiA/AmiB activator)
MAIPTKQTILTIYGYLRHPALEWVIRTTSHILHRLPLSVAGGIAPLLLASCAELGEFRSDIAHVRSDLRAHTQSLSQLAARVDALERRQADAERTARQTQQNLSEAVEVLLRKALMTENRQAPRESGKSQARQLPAATEGVSPRGGNAHQGKNHLSLGMTQDDVRLKLGAPLSIEHVGAFVFWHYSAVSNQQYVIFEQVSGQVSGWRGL